MTHTIALSLLLSTITPPGDALDLELALPPACTDAERVVGLLPFGAGQLMRGDTGLGVALATSQAAALAVNLGTYLDGRGLEHDRAQGHVVAQYASLAVFGLLWSVGAFDAQSVCDQGGPPAARLSLDVQLPPLPLVSTPDPCQPCGSPQFALSPCATCRAEPIAGVVQLALGGMWANVDVDGERVLDNQMGAFSLDLPPGEHVVRFSQPRAHPEEVRLVVDPEAPPNRVVVRLEPLPARLHITGAPAGALVRVAQRRVLVGDGPVVIDVPVEPGGDGETVVEVLGPTGATLIRHTVHLSPAADTTLALQPEP